MCVCMFKASVYLLDTSDISPKKALPFGFNPLKGKPKNAVLSNKRQVEVALAISAFVTYDSPENCEATEKFLPIKERTECIFAKKANIWGCRDFDLRLTLGKSILYMYILN